MIMGERVETIPFTNPAEIIGASANLAALAALRLSSWFIACTSTFNDHWQVEVGVFLKDEKYL